MPLVVYFDEVGNPTFDPSDKDFPVFAIVLFICDSQIYTNQVVTRVNDLKFKWFGHEGVILHSRDIRRAVGDFAFLQNPNDRHQFYEDLNAIMGGCDYQLIAVAIRKDRLAAQYIYPADPYDLSLLFALERLVSVLEGHGQTAVTIIAEQRGAKEDRALYVAFQRIVTSGSQFVDGARFRTIKFTLCFRPKAMNIVGTQMADLAAYPIARRALDSTKENPAFQIVQAKLCRQLKIFP